MEHSLGGKAVKCAKFPVILRISHQVIILIEKSQWNFMTFEIKCYTNDNSLDLTLDSIKATAGGGLKSLNCFPYPKCQILNPHWTALPIAKRCNVWRLQQNGCFKSNFNRYVFNFNILFAGTGQADILKIPT